MELIVLKTLLEELAERLGVAIRYERMQQDPWSSSGGICTFNSRRLIIVRSNAPLAEQVGVLLDALSDMDLDSIYVPPALRCAFERRRH